MLSNLLLRRIIAVGMVLFQIMVLSHVGAATSLTVTLTVNPNTPTISAGSDMVVVTTNAQGVNLTFTWTLEGPGRLEEKGAAAFYWPPSQVEQPAEVAITVIVANVARQTAQASATFTITKKKTSVKTVVIGAGAAVALGGGLALALNQSGNAADPVATPTPQPTCGGVIIGGFCWYLGAVGESCRSVCAVHGAYHDATRLYAGSDGEASNCNNVLDALGVPQTTSIQAGGNCGDGFGCGYLPAPYNRRVLCSSPTTTPEASWWTRQRVCACTE